MHLFNQFCTAVLVGSALTISAMLASTSAHAAISLDQFTVVAGGWQLERQCGHLGTDERDTLGQVAAHAEIEAARAHGADKVKEVLEGAEQFGREMGDNCGDETREAVNRSYDVAVKYATARTAEETRKANRRNERRQERDDEADVRQDTAPAILARFGTQTEAYYLQRRCRHLPYNQDMAFWTLIRRQHMVLIRRYGAGAVGRVSRRAKWNANSDSVYCGAETRRMVRTGLRTIRRDAAAY